MKSTWRFVLKIIGLSLALAGAVCLVIGFWDKLAEDAVAAKEALCRKRPRTGIAGPGALFHMSRNPAGIALTEYAAASPACRPWGPSSGPPG